MSASLPMRSTPTWMLLDSGTRPQDLAAPATARPFTGHLKDHPPIEPTTESLRNHKSIPPHLPNTAPSRHHPRNTTLISSGYALVGDPTRFIVGAAVVQGGGRCPVVRPAKTTRRGEPVPDAGNDDLPDIGVVKVPQQFAHSHVAAAGAQPGHQRGGLSQTCLNERNIATDSASTTGSLPIPMPVSFC